MQSHSLPQPAWGGTLSPCCCQVPGLAPEVEQGSESCHVARVQSDSCFFSCIPLPLPELPEIWLRFFLQHRGAGLSTTRE